MFSPYGGEYQQIYSAADFSGPVSISGIAFASSSASFSGGGGQEYDALTVGLSTTTASLANPSSSYAANKGADFTTVFTYVSSGKFLPTLTDTDTFDMFIPMAAPFIYNPARGNLLLDVNIGTLTSGGTNFFVSGDAPDTTRIFNSGGGGTPTVNPDFGLLTRFTVGPAISAVPEPSPLPLLALGLLPVGLLVKRRRHVA